MSAQITDPYRWNNRVLLLFAPTADNPTLQQQLTLLTQKMAEVTDRDLVFYKIFLKTGLDPIHKTISEADVLSFRSTYRIEKDGFTLILVGKDGTEKLRRWEVVQPEILFDLIDSMPMRKREMGKF